MMFALIMVREGGETFPLFFDAVNSRITYADGSLIDIAPLGVLYTETDHKNSPVLEPDKAEAKSHAVKVLRIQLGMLCNFSCAYCVQAMPRAACDPGVADVEDFLRRLDEWVGGEPAMVEFWGGEPFVYWPKLKFLMEGVRKTWPSTALRLVTNGSLLDVEKAKWLAALGNCAPTLSHDGPGQHIRGKDPLSDPEVLEAVQILAREAALHIHAVMTWPHHSPAALLQFFHDKLGTWDLQISASGLKYPPPHERGMCLTPNSPAEYQEMRHRLFREFTMPRVFGSAIVAMPLHNLLYQIGAGVPARARSQSCSMDQPGHLAVTLAGDVLVCHNTTSSRHRIGSVYDFEGIRLAGCRSWHTRPECMSCPALLSCSGGCMIMEGSARALACDNNFSYGLVYLATLLYALTGAFLVRVDGECIRFPGVTSVEF